MKNKNKLLIVLVLCLICTILVSSYGYFKKTLTQEEDNSISTIDCFDIEYTDGDAISLTSTFPISEQDGFRTKPYRFYITNKCDEWVNLEINLESLELSEKSLPDEYLKVNLTSGDKRLVTTKLDSSLSTDVTIENAKAAYKLYSQELKPYAKVSFDLRAWVHEDVTYVDDSVNAFFKGKISVNGKFMQGPPTSENNIANIVVENEERTGYFWDYKDQIINVEFQNSLTPMSNADYSFDISENNDGKVMTYLVKDQYDNNYYNLYIQSDDKVNLSEDSSYFFANFPNLLSIEGFSYVDTSQVTNMSHMFYNCEKLNKIDLQFLDTKNVLDLSSMFENCKNFSDLDISYLYLGNTVYLDNMLKNSGVFKADLSNKNLDNVISMVGMFEGTTIKEVNLTNVSAKKLESMANAFKDCLYLTSLNTTNFVTPSLKSMEGTFYNTKMTSIDLSTMSSSNITNMKNTFANCSELLSVNLGTFIFDENSTIEAIFMNSIKLDTVNLSNINTSKVSNFSHMFDGITYMLDLNLSELSTENAIDMSYMFANLKNLSTINLENFDTSNVENMSHMFENNEKLVSLDVSNFNTSKVKDMSYMFYDCSSFKLLDVGGFDTSNVENMSHMFENTSSLTSLDVSNFDTSNVEDMSFMFKWLGESYSQNNNIELDVSNFNTSKVTNMSSMFAIAHIKEGYYLDVSGFDTSNVTNMSNMFDTLKCTQPLNLNNFDTSNVTDMTEMFDSYKQPGNLDISSFNTSSVTSMKGMFSSLSLQEGNIIFGSNFDTSNVTDMSNMFDSFRSGDIDLSNFNTSNVTNMAYMFRSYQGGNVLGFNSFDTSNVTNMTQMFFSFSDSSMSIDISNLDVSKVSYASSMFDGTSANINIDGLIFASATSLSYFARNALNVSGSIFVDFSKFSDLSYSSWSSNLQNAFYTSTSVYPSDRKIFLNYISSTSSAVNSVINYYPPYNCLASVGQLINYEDVGYHSIQIDSNTEAATTSLVVAQKNVKISLIANDADYDVKSFKVNGELVKGNEFIMPDEDVEITDVELVEYIYVQSEQYPYPSNLSKVYYENTFENATSIKVKISYSFGNDEDWVEFYNEDGLFTRWYHSCAPSWREFEMSGDYIKIMFFTDSEYNNAAGFTIKLYPVYD